MEFGNKVYMINSTLLLELVSSEAFYNLHRINGIKLFPMHKITTAKIKTKKRKRQSVIDNLNIYDIIFPIPSSTMTKYPPTSAAFFGVYNKAKTSLQTHAYSENLNQSLCHILAVYMAHTASCMFRVPVDLYKQDKTKTGLKPWQTIQFLFNSPGLASRSLRSLTHTVVREMPFCSIKFPLWEFFKIQIEKHKPNKTCETYESAIVGGLAGGLAASITLPFDKVYKRIYIEKKSDHYQRWRTLLTIRDMAAKEGLKGMYAGVVNRFAMISFGGFLFFGCYEQKKRILSDEE